VADTIMFWNGYSKCECPARMVLLARSTGRRGYFQLKDLLGSCVINHRRDNIPIGTDLSVRLHRSDAEPHGKSMRGIQNRLAARRNPTILSRRSNDISPDCRAKRGPLVLLRLKTGTLQALAESHSSSSRKECQREKHLYSAGNNHSNC
jgi:hypothetical protein